MRIGPHLTLAFFALSSLCIQNVSYAQAPRDQGRQCTIGHFSVSIPQGWNSFSDTDKAGARREFSTDLAPGLKQYQRAGDATPRMGEFEIYQKPPYGQLIGWTLVIPDQTDFLKEILKKEDVEFQKRKNLAGGQVRSGFCRLVKVGGNDVVRVDVEMANGGKSTNLIFWSPKRPGLITTLMLGMRPNYSDQTRKDYETIISSLRIDEHPKSAK